MRTSRTWFLTNFFMCAIFVSGTICLGQIAALPPTEDDRFVQIKDLSGEVQVRVSSESDWVLAEKGTRLKQDGEIKTGKDSLAVILLDKEGETGKIDIKPDTWMRIAELKYSGALKDKRTIMDLALGQVLVEAGTLKGEATFQIRTPTSTTTSVRGTVFEVKVEETQNSITDAVF